MKSPILQSLVTHRRSARKWAPHLPIPGHGKAQISPNHHVILSERGPGRFLQPGGGESKNPHFTPLQSARIALCLFLLLLSISAHAADSYRIVHTFPHDQQAFTQGLVFVDGHLYESTGLNGHSSLRMLDLSTGRILKLLPAPDKYFAEGLTDWGSTLIQLTWQAHTAFVYDRATFRILHTFHYDGEGWGLTHDSKYLILSDGTATLRFLDPATFKVIRRITVKDHGSPVTELNELEFIHGEIYANIWHSDHIARISPATGAVLGWIDLASLKPFAVESNPEAVLNGIAWDAEHDRLYVTGKLWPSLFEIAIVPAHGKATHQPAR